MSGGALEVALALYRKYRPGSFAEVKGQEHVTGPLCRALANGRLHHAYLFSGPRGCGKTSSARILARSLNCAQGPTPEPCGACESCVALAPNGAGSLDVIEIDAASHNGVDDARDLRDKAFFAPVRDRFKVYIIDEAHMITSGAFNALLKLVEEPPEFVKFVFATTEPEKILQTIRSRTHHYPFRLMPRNALTELLQGIVASEGISVDATTVLPLVVRAAQGSARDGLSILDQVLASAGPDGVNREMAASLLGVTPDVLLDEVIEAFGAGDAAAVFAAVDRVLEAGHDPRRFAGDVLERLRDLVILEAVPDAGDKGILDCTPEQLERMARQAAALGRAGLSRAADLIQDGLTEMRGTTAPRLLLELICARVLLPAAGEGAVLARLERLERRLDIGRVQPDQPVTPPGRVPAEAPSVVASARPTTSPATDDVRPDAGRRASAEPASAPTSARWPEAATPGTPAAPTGPSGTPAPPAAEAPAAPPPAGVDGEPGSPVGLDAAAIRRVWDTVLEHVKQRKRVTHARLIMAQVIGVEDGALSLSFTTPTLARQFQEGVNVDYLREALQAVVGADLTVLCSSGDGGPAAPADPRAGRPAPEVAGPTDPYAGFAVGDEPAEESESTRKSEQGDGAALRLIEQTLAATVVQTTQRREGD